MHAVAILPCIQASWSTSIFPFFASYYLHLGTKWGPAHHLLVSRWRREPGLLVWLRLHLPFLHHEPRVALHHWRMTSGGHRRHRHAWRGHPEVEVACRSQMASRREAEGTEGSRATKLRIAALRLFLPAVWEIGLRRGCWSTAGTGARVPAISGCWNFMVVLSLVCRDHGFQIMRRSLHVLAHWTALVRTFVVAPAGR